MLYAGLKKTGVTRQVRAPNNWTISLFVFVLGLVTFSARLWFPVGTFYEPLHQEFTHYPQYIAMFTLGALAYRREWLSNFFRLASETMAMDRAGLRIDPASNCHCCGCADR